MTSEEPPHVTSSDPPRRRTGMWVVGVAALAAVVTTGVLIGRGNDNGADLNVAGGSGETTSSSPASESTTATGDELTAPPAASAGDKGTGDPIVVSGESPIDGKTVDLAAFRGKPVVLQIWASWCPGCNAEAPEVAKLSKERKDVAFVGLNYRDTDDAAKGFYAKYNWTFPSIRDSGGDQSLRLGLQGTPTTIFLDAEHREVGRILGEASEENFTKAINKLTS